MAIPAQSLSGTEVLRRECIKSQSTDTTAFRFDTLHPTTGDETYTVPALHIITMVSIIICETAGNGEQFHMQAVMHTTSASIKLLADQTIGGKDTFIWNDRFTLIGGDALKIYSSAAAVLDVWYTYIDQSWE